MKKMKSCKYWDFASQTKGCLRFRSGKYVMNESRTLHMNKNIIKCCVGLKSGMYIVNESRTPHIMKTFLECACGSDQVCILWMSHDGNTVWMSHKLFIWRKVSLSVRAVEMRYMNTLYEYIIHYKAVTNLYILWMSFSNGLVSCSHMYLYTVSHMYLFIAFHMYSMQLSCTFTVRTGSHMYLYTLSLVHLNTVSHKY